MATIFESGFEDGPLGCGLSELLDAGKWDDYGPSGTCAASPAIAEIIDTDQFCGAQCLRVHMKDGDGSNGPDFRQVVAFASNKAFTYLRWKQKWDSNFRWSPGRDHKMFITGPLPENQYVYFNLRGAPGGASAYGAIHIILPDTVVSDTSVLVTPGEWVDFKLAIKWGANGWVRAWIDDVQLTLTVEAGNSVNPENVNPGSGGGFVKFDTTYNDFAYFEANVAGNSSNTYLDDVTVDDAVMPGAPCAGPGSSGSSGSGPSGSGPSGSGPSGSGPSGSGPSGSGPSGSGPSGSGPSGSGPSGSGDDCIDVASTPFSRLVTQAEFNVASEIWFCYDALAPIVLGVRTDAGGTFTPRTTIYEADRTTVVQGPVNGTRGIWATLPTAGTYAIKVEKQGGGTSDFDFTTSVDVAILDDFAVDEGDLIINDDLDRPGTVFSPAGTLKGFKSDLPGGEMGAILPNGVSIWHDRYGHHDPANKIALLDANLNYLGSVDCGLTGVNFPIFGADATQFYVMNQAGELWTVSDAGVQANTGYAFPLEHELPVAIAVNQAGTTLYWAADDEDGVIRTVDLGTLLDGPDFYTIPGFVSSSDKVARTANNHPGELFWLPDGSLVTWWFENAELTYHLIQISAAGALLHDYTYVDPIQLDHLAQVYGQSDYVLIWLYTTIGFDTGRFGRLTLATGVISDDFTHDLFEDGVNMLGSEKFGMSTSCSFVVMQAAAAGSGSSSGSEGSAGSGGSGSSSSEAEPAPECVLDQPAANCWSGTVNPARNPVELIDS